MVDQRGDPVLSTALLVEMAEAAEHGTPMPSLPSPETRKRLRVESGVRLEDVAAAVGVVKSSVMQWERGLNPQAIHAVRYGRVLRFLEERRSSGACSGSLSEARSIMEA